MVWEWRWEIALCSGGGEFSLEWVWCPLEGGEVVGFVDGFMGSCEEKTAALGWLWTDFAGMVGAAMSGESTRDVRRRRGACQKVKHVLVVAGGGGQSQ